MEWYCVSGGVLMIERDECGSPSLPVTLSY